MYLPSSASTFNCFYFLSNIYIYLTTTYNATLLHSSIYYIAAMFVSDIIRKVVVGNRALALEDDCWLIIANG